MTKDYMLEDLSSAYVSVGADSEIKRGDVILSYEVKDEEIEKVVYRIEYDTDHSPNGLKTCIQKNEYIQGELYENDSHDTTGKEYSVVRLRPRKRVYEHARKTLSKYISEINKQASMGGVEFREPVGVNDDWVPTK